MPRPTRPDLRLPLSSHHVCLELMQWARNCDPIVRNRTNNSQHVRLIISQLMNIKRISNLTSAQGHWKRSPTRPDCNPEAADMRVMCEDRLLHCSEAHSRRRRRKRGPNEKAGCK
jgi:hypothetical protein